MAKKRIPRSVPQSLRELARRGERYRFHGGPLGESEMDRTIAEWMDSLPDRSTWPIVKTIVYSYITGRMVALTDDGEPIYHEPGQVGAIEAAILEMDD
jgi:hypothetical protein